MVPEAPYLHTNQYSAQPEIRRETSLTHLLRTSKLKEMGSGKECAA